MTSAARPARRLPSLPPGWARVGVSLVALALVVLGAAPASAHAELIDTDPAEGSVVETAPATVTLTFNEPVRLTSQEIAVYDASGDEVGSTAGSSGTERRRLAAYMIEELKRYIAREPLKWEIDREKLKMLA